MMQYTPGTPAEWLLLAADTGFLFVDTQSAHDSASPDSLLEALTSDEPVQSILDVLASHGLGSTPPFALVQWTSDDSAQVLVRGSATVTVVTATGEVVLTGSGVSTWRETTVDGVESVRAGEETADDALPLEIGAVWATGASSAPGVAASERPSRPAASSTSKPDADAAGAAATDSGSDSDTDAESSRPARKRPPTARSLAAAAAAEAKAAATPEAATPDAASTDAAPTVAVSVAAPSTDAPPTTPAIIEVPVPEGVTEQTISEAPELSSPPSLGSNPPPAAAQDERQAEADLYGHLFEETIVRSIEDAAVRPPEEDEDAENDAASGDVEGDHDGMTVMSGDLAELRASRGATSDDAPSIPESRSLFLELSTGGREPINGPILVGRSPSVSKVSSGQVPRLVTIPGDQDISRNHAQFALEGDTVVVTDLHSRNGTTVILPGKTPQLLRQGEPTAVLVDTVIDLGGGVTLTVREEA